MTTISRQSPTFGDKALNKKGNQMNCFKCSQPVDSPGKKDIVLHYVVAIRTFHSSWTSHSQVSSSTTLTNSIYQYVSNEDMIYCANCVKHRNKQHFNFFLLSFAFTIPFWLGIFHITPFIEFTAYLMGIGFIGTVATIITASTVAITEKAHKHLINLYNQKQPADYQIFTTGEWATMNKTLI